MADGTLPIRREAVSSLIRPESLQADKYYQQSTFHLAVNSSKVTIRLFKEDFELMNNKEPDYDNPGSIWSYIEASNIALDTNALPYDNHVKVEVGRCVVREARRLH